MPIKIIAAGAGSGKTYRITEELVKRLETGAVRPNGVIATTFTNAAAAELKDRVKLKLLERNKAVLATEVAASMIGTVHSIGIRLIKRFAYEAGVSPDINIMDANDESAYFNQSIANILTDEQIEKMNYLATMLGLNKSGDFDWRKNIQEISNLIRQNNFEEETIIFSKENSWESFKKYLPTPTLNLAAAKTKLKTIIDELLVAVLEVSDTTKTTADRIIELKSIYQDISKNDFPWHQWIKITKLKVSKKSEALFEPLIEFAEKHIEIAEFQENIKEYIYQIFDISFAALQQYQHFKKVRGFVDYTDMEAHILDLLENPTVKKSIESELDLLIVDEFQDTSPLQLAIFLKLSLLSNEAIWVGDTKQSIYGFRGAEPRLMQAIIEEQGGIKTEDILSGSWRSRPDLVNMTNCIFTRAFQNLPPEQIILRPKIEDTPEMGTAIHYWHFTMEGTPNKSNQNWYQKSIAAQIKKWMATEPKVRDKNTKLLRDAQFGDIAILCRTNLFGTNMAEALHHVGIKSATPRFGLIQTKEIVLFQACLKFIFSKNDSLAVAELLLLAEDFSLKEIVEDRLKYIQSEENELWGSQQSIVQFLLELRTKCTDLSVKEICELVLNSLDLRRIVAKWGDVDQRWANLDKLLSFAKKYEDTCMNIYQSATLGGFLLWLKDLESKEQDEQAFSVAENAVFVGTYHKSKGLEWPIVISINLENELKESVFGVSIESKQPDQRLDLKNVLGNRWIRFWVNPYDNLVKNTLLSDSLSLGNEAIASRKNALEEGSRLLYVGLTRARDYQIIVGNKDPKKWLNMAFNDGNPDVPVFDIHSLESPFYFEDKIIPVAFDSIVLPENIESTPFSNEKFNYFEIKNGRKAFPLKKLDTISFSKKMKYKTLQQLTLYPQINVSKNLDVVLNAYLNVAVFNKSQDFKLEIFHRIANRMGVLLAESDMQNIVNQLDKIDAYFHKATIISDNKLFQLAGIVDHHTFNTIIPRVIIDDFGWNLIIYQFKNEVDKNELAAMKIAAAIINQRQISSIKYWIIQPLKGIVEEIEL